MLQNQVVCSLQEPEWFVDEYGVHNLMFRVQYKDSNAIRMFIVHAHITSRPVYCDRGHYHLNVDGPFNFDSADSFPRYFMDLNRAKEETVEFLRWRIQCSKYLTTGLASAFLQEERPSRERATP